MVDLSHQKQFCYFAKSQILLTRWSFTIKIMDKVNFKGIVNYTQLYFDFNKEQYHYKTYHIMPFHCLIKWANGLVYYVNIYHHDDGDDDGGYCENKNTYNFET